MSQPVADELWRRIGVSLRLLVIGSVLGTIIGVVVGVGRHPAVPPLRPGHHGAVPADHQHTDVRARQPADPRCVAGQLGRPLADLRVHRGDIPTPVGGAWNQFVDRLQHLVFADDDPGGRSPGTAGISATPCSTCWARDFIRTARAKGLTRRQALINGLRTALIPMATLFAYSVAGLIHQGGVRGEDLGWHGMGEWVVQGIGTQDTNITAAVTVFSRASGAATGTALTSVRHPDPGSG